MQENIDQAHCWLGASALAGVRTTAVECEWRRAMRQQTSVALLATKVPASALGQYVREYSTTLAKLWASKTPGFDKANIGMCTVYRK